jgi:hypothetical protein
MNRKVVLILLVAAAWAASGVVSVGLHFAYVQRSYPLLAVSDYKFHRNMNLIFSVAGPASLAAVFVTGQHGEGFLLPGQQAWEEAQRTEAEAEAKYK